MSKAILVMDMPSCCNVCTFNNAIGECKFVGNVDVALQHGLRYVECPLKPIPEKQYISLKEAIGIKCSCYSDGWNDCIDEILGEEE